MSAAVSIVQQKLDIPTFDLHKVEESLRVNHRIFNGTPLTEEDIQDAVSQYRVFLARHKAAGMPEQFESPGLFIDRVWHTHMCETEQYYNNCISYFGKMFHHAGSICENGAEPGPE